MKFKFPKNDVDCQRVVPFQVKDLERALKYVEDTVECVQAGGNVGVWAKYLAQRFDNVYTFEPDQENFECLVENCPEENIYKFQAGLGEENGHGKVVGDKRNCGAYQMEYEDGGVIPILKIDDLGLRPSLIVLDIEGMELLALRGAFETLKAFGPVVMIEDKGLSKKYDIEKGEAGLFLEKLGYRLVDEVHRDLIYVRD